MSTTPRFAFVRQGDALHPHGRESKVALANWPENFLFSVEVKGFPQTPESRHFFALVREAREVLGFQGEDLLAVLKASAGMFKLVKYKNINNEGKMVMILDSISVAQIGQKKHSSSLLKMAKALDALVENRRKEVSPKDKPAHAVIKKLQAGIQDLLSKFESGEEE